MENIKTYTQTVISFNVKDRAERTERLKEVLALMLVEMWKHKKRQK